MTKALTAVAIFLAALLPAACDGAFDDQCLRRPDAVECKENR